MVPFRSSRPTRRRRQAGFSFIEVMMSIGIVSISLAVFVPRLTSTKKQAIASAVGVDLRTFAAAFDAYAQEHGNFPAEVDAGVMPPEMTQRLADKGWLRVTPMGGQYNWDSDQVHFGQRYKAVIQISATTASPLPEDVELWETIDKTIDDGSLSSGSFRLGVGNEPIFIVSP